MTPTLVDPLFLAFSGYFWGQWRCVQTRQKTSRNTRRNLPRITPGNQDKYLSWHAFRITPELENFLILRFRLAFCLSWLLPVKELYVPTYSAEENVIVWTLLDLPKSDNKFYPKNIMAKKLAQAKKFDPKLGHLATFPYVLLHKNLKKIPFSPGTNLGTKNQARN